MKKQYLAFLLISGLMLSTAYANLGVQKGGCGPDSAEGGGDGSGNGGGSGGAGGGGAGGSGGGALKPMRLPGLGSGYGYGGGYGGGASGSDSSGGSAPGETQADCPCNGCEGTVCPNQGAGSASPGSAGSAPGHSGPSAVVKAKNGSVDVSISFGSPATENIGVTGYFSIYAEKPSSVIFSPQMLQYNNPLLNRISQNVINSSYKDSIGIAYATAPNTRAAANNGAGVIAGANNDFQGGYGENVISNSLPSGITHQVQMIGANRQAMTFDFSPDNSTASMSGESAHMGYKMQMVNQNGEPVTSNPYYYDLYLGRGSFVRYQVSTGFPVSYHTPSGRVLKNSAASVGLEAVYDADGTIRQIWSLADGLADVVITAIGVSYEIRFYLPSQVGAKADGVYQVTGTPYMTLKIEKGESQAEVNITKTVGGVSTLTLYRYSYAAEGWIVYYPDDLAVNSKSTSYDNSHTIRTVSEVLKTPDGQVAKKIQKVYQKYNFGDRLMSSTLDPDGLNLRSSYTYYTNSSQKGSYGKKATQSLADGSWTTYQYNNDGWETVLISPWLNGEFNSAAAQNVATYLSYTPLDSRDVLVPEDKRPRTIEQKILGITTRKEFRAYYFEDNAYVEVQEIGTTQAAQWGDASNLRTVWKYYPQGECTSASAGRLKQLIKPDGTTETHSYEYGNLQQNASDGTVTFTPGTGNAVREYIVYGTTESPDGIAYKTSREERLFNEYGDRIYTAAQIYTGSSYETAMWIRNQFDEQHRMLSERKSNGELSEYTWNCCQKESETLSDGTQYLYTYDALLRMVSKTKVGIGDQPDQVTTYQYNAANQVVNETTTSGELSESISREYNQAGLKIKETDKAGLVTSIAYSAGVNSGANRHGVKITVVMPGDFTLNDTKHCDGSDESLTGTVSVSTYYRYGVDGDGSVWGRELIGSPDSLRRKTITLNLAGRVVSSISSGYNGNVEEHFYYNIKNQLTGITKTGSAPLLIEYNSLGEQVRIGLDVDANGSLELSSNDRIWDTNNEYVQENGWWKKSIDKTYGITGSSDATVISINKERFSGFASGVAAELQLQDIHGNATVLTEMLDRANKQITESALEPDSAVAVQKVTVNGLVISERSKSNLTTTYGYDALSRLVTITKSRIGTTTIAYHSDTGKKGLPATITDAAGNTTSYDFDTSSGRLLWQKNAMGKYIRYAYNSYGQITRIWGDTQYPREFDYNNLGQLIMMKTYRTGNDWGNTEWPGQSIVGDITGWNYDAASGLVVSKIDAALKSVNYTYTVDGKLASRTWARGIVTNYSYDSATGQLLKVDYADDTPDITYTYNRLGQLATVQDAAGPRTFGYNTTFDRISETINGIYNKVLTYAYATAGVKGRYLGFSLDNVSNSTYSYDSYGRLNQIDGFGGAFQYTRLADSGLIENLIRPNGVNSTWSYEAHRNLVTQLANGSVSTFGYVNDALGRWTSMSRGGSAFAIPDVITYGYNDRSEVISALSNVNENYHYAYNFDPIGNRQTATLSGTGWNYTSNNLNQYTALLFGGMTQNPTYDFDGNMLIRDGWTQTWNGENRLIETIKGDTRLTFAYDYMGRRVEKKVYNGETVTKHLRFVYNGYKLAEELNALDDNATLRKYTWQDGIDLDVPLSVHDATANATYFYTTDANKNVSELTDGSGAVVAHYEYAPFGAQTIATGAYAAANPFRFSSEYYDPETKLIYYNYRYYDPQLGRWLSRDPIGEEGGWNLYGMVKNNLISFSDYLGLEVPAMDSVTANPSVATGMNLTRGMGFKDVAKRMLLDGLKNLLKPLLDLLQPCSEDKPATEESDSSTEETNKDKVKPKDPMDDYPTDPDDWTPPENVREETKTKDNTGGRHRQWKDKETGKTVRRWDKEGRENGKERPAHWHDYTKDDGSTHIPPNR